MNQQEGSGARLRSAFLLSALRTGPLFWLGLLATAGPGCQRGTAEGQAAAAAQEVAPPQPPVPVGIAAVEVAEIRDTSEYLATLKSRQSIVLLPSADGLITQIFVAAGDHVRSGQPVLQIDPARQREVVSSEKSSRDAKLASLTFLQHQAERMARMHEGGAVSKQEMEQARTAYGAAKADAAAQGAQVRSQQVQLRYYRVTAPVDGTIGDISVRVGDRVTPLTSLTTIDNSKILEAYISVPAERAEGLRPELSVELLSGDGSQLVETKVGFISPLMNDETQSVLIKAQVDNEKGLLRAGQIVRARIIWSRRKGPVVPLISLIRLGDQHFAFVAEKSGQGLRARQRAVTLGELFENRYAVRSGLAPGARIVVSGVQKLRDGAPISEEK